MTFSGKAAAVNYNAGEIEKGDLTDQHIVQMVEHWQQSHDLEADGWCGPATQESLDAAWPYSSEGDGSVSRIWAAWDGPMQEQPTNRGEVYKVFGNPGAGELDKGWRGNHIVECHGSNRLPGVPVKWYVQVHRLIEPYLREALRRAQISAPEYRIDRIGGFNFRHISHNSKNPLSMHSWGIAVDINPRDNFSKKFARAMGPKAWSPEYMKIWPHGVPEAFVRAFQSCGFAWGSDWDEDGLSEDHTRYDGMHFEWVARDGEAHLV